jgi:hypothetical protein
MPDINAIMGDLADVFAGLFQLLRSVYLPTTGMDAIAATMWFFTLGIPGSYFIKRFIFGKR